jgi:UDP-N-acetylglucosamine transferase subunit ALG13
MIFVTLGTNEARFDRLAHAVARLDVHEEVVVQHGHSAAVGPPGATLVDFLAFDELVDHVRRARVVVTHAGVGSIMVALANRKRPVVVPRRKAHGEAVDDHQLQLGRRFSSVGLVTLVEEPEDLAATLVDVDEVAAIVQASSELGADLGRFIGAAIHGDGTVAAARP